MQTRSETLPAPSAPIAISPEAPTSPRASRRSILAGVAASIAAGTALNATAPVAAKGAEPDPIFDLIERHREAVAKSESSSKGLTSVGPLARCRPIKPAGL